MSDTSIPNTTRIDADAFARLIPRGATHAIEARCEEDQSDSMTDYWGSRTTATVIIGFSAHGRDLFPELRKAAATFEPTADLGPGMGRYTARVIITAPEVIPGGYYAGRRSHWHSDLYVSPDGTQEHSGVPFVQRARASAWIYGRPEIPQISFDGVLVSFGWDLEEHKIEHREKYSMGHGYYLAGEGQYSGWQVRKSTLPRMRPGESLVVADHLIAPAVTAAPAQVETGASGTSESGAPSYSLNAAKNGIEIRFPAKPAASVLDNLKSAGWRWSRFSACWWHKDTLDARILAVDLCGKAEQPADDDNVPDAMEAQATA